MGEETELESGSLVKDHSFESVAKAYNAYITSVATSYANRGKVFEDIRQELLIVLWKCYSRYQDVSMSRLKAIFIRSAGHKLIDLHRAHIRAPIFISLDSLPVKPSAKSCNNIDHIISDCPRWVQKSVMEIVSGKKVRKAIRDKAEMAIRETIYH